MQKLIQFFVHNNRFTYVVTILFIVAGFMGMTSIRRESYPAVDFAQAVITTNYPGASPEEVESKVTKKLEDEIRTVSGLKDTTSVSQSGLSKIFVRIDMDHVNVKEVMNDLEKAIDRVNDLPREVPDKPLFKEVKSSEFPVIEMALVGPNDNRKRDQLVEFFQDELENLPGVLEVRLSGYKRREFSVLINKDKLDEYYISVDEVLQAIETNTPNIPLGDIESYDSETLVRLLGEPRQIEDLQNLYVRSSFGGHAVKLTDVAQVIDGKERADDLASVNGSPATLMTITQKTGTDTIALMSDLENKIKSLEPALPEGFKLVPYFNEGRKVIGRVDVLFSNAITGLLLVVVFLLIFLPGRIGLMASLSLPIAVLATFSGMQAVGFTLNSITILALVIALGMLVDNSVVIAENFARLRRDGEEPFKAAVHAAGQFWLPITATALTTIAAFLPMVVTKGIMGEFIFAIPIVVTFSLMFSLFESFFLLPVRLLGAEKLPRFSFITRMIFRKQSSESESHEDWFDHVSDRFESFVKVCLRNQYKVLVGFGVLIAFSLFLLVAVNKFILFPADQTELYVARYELPLGAPLERTLEQGQNLERQIESKLGSDVRALVTKAGVSQTRPNDPKAKEGENVGMVLVFVTREASFELKSDVALEKLRQIKMPVMKSLTFEAQVNGPPVGYAVNANFRSNNGEILEKVVSQTITFLKSIDGVIDVQTDVQLGNPELFIDLDRKKVSEYGLNLNTIGRSVQAALEGFDVREIALNNKDFDIHVEFQPQYKTDIEHLETILISNNSGQLIPLSRIAKFRKAPSSEVVRHYQFQRSKAVTANVDELKITSIEANAKLNEYLKDIKKEFPEVSVSYLGQEESTNESFQSLVQALVLAIFGIFAILVFVFNSYSLPLVVMSTIPLGLVGISVAFLVHNKPVGFFALIGIIGLAGIVVNSGIVLISFIEELREEGTRSLDDVLAQSAKLRLKAVLVTSLTTVGGLIPTAYGIGGRDEILIPMTLAMAWGLVGGTLLTLIWIPCGYKILFELKTFFRSLKQRMS